MPEWWAKVDAVRLEPAELEERFRREMLARDKTQVIVVIVLTVVTVTGFVALDLSLLPSELPLYVSIFSRCVTVIVSLAAIWLVRHLSNSRFFDRIVLMWMIVVVGHMLAVNVLRPADYVAVVVWDLVAILVGYTLVPVPLRFQVPPTLLLTAGGGVLWLIYRLRLANTYETVAVLAAYSLANIYGIFMSGRLNRSRRQQFVLLLQETEARKELADRSIELEKAVDELDAFAHTVAHDLKNPLSIVMAYGDILLEEAADMRPGELAKIAQAVHQMAKKAVDIVEALLLLSSMRKEQVEMVPLEMSEVIAEVQERLAMMIADHQGEIVLPKTWPVAMGYAPWVEEIWVNYISNGLKYGGRPPRLEIGATSQDDGLICFWVQDNGDGIPVASQDALFTEFTRLKAWGKGHGLGLSVVRRIVDKLGGQSGVRSAGVPGQGSRFYFTLPEAEKARF